jgi:hypothetical protein
MTHRTRARRAGRFGKIFGAGVVIAVGSTWAYEVAAACCKTWITTRFPGNMCEYYSPQGLDYYFDPAGFSANGVKNADSSSRYANCPIVKPDVQLNPASFHYTRSAWIVTTEASASACSLYVRAMDGSSWGTYSSTVSNLGNGRYYHKFDCGSDCVLDTTSKTQSIYCQVGSNKVIETYAHQTAYTY